MFTEKNPNHDPDDLARLAEFKSDHRHTYVNVDAYLVDDGRVIVKLPGTYPREYVVKEQ